MSRKKSIKYKDYLFYFLYFLYMVGGEKRARNGGIAQKIFGGSFYCLLQRDSMSVLARSKSFSVTKIFISPRPLTEKACTD